MNTNRNTQNASSSPASANVVAIRPGVKIPKQRDEDSAAIFFGDMSRKALRDSYELAQTDPNGVGHLQMLNLTRLVEKLPSNNLKLHVTPLVSPDQAVLAAYRAAMVAAARERLLDAEWLFAWHVKGEDPADWRDRKDAARDASREAYETLVRTPAPSRSLHALKRDRRLAHSIDWLRKYWPEMAAILDEEDTRLRAETEARKAQRAGHRRGEN